MPDTRAQLVNKALSKLSIIAEGQDVSDGDNSKMDGLVNAAMALLASLDIFFVADFGQLGPTGGSIDDDAFLPLYLARQEGMRRFQPARRRKAGSGVPDGCCGSADAVAPAAIEDQAEC